MPVVQAQAAGAFVLPDEAAKETYLAQAVRLGRFHLIGSFVTLTIFLGYVGATGPIIANVSSELLDAALFALLLLSASQLFWLMVARSADKNFLKWLGELATGEEPKSDQADRRHELRLCCPGWMVAAEALVFLAVVVSIADRWIARRLEGCSRALRSMEADSTLSAAPASGCLGAIDLLLVAMMIGIIAPLVAYWWKWRRWNG